MGHVEADGDGFGIVGSFALNDDLHLFGSYDDQSFDFGIDSTSIAVGGGASPGFMTIGTS